MLYELHSKDVNNTRNVSESTGLVIIIPTSRQPGMEATQAKHICPKLSLQNGMFIIQACPKLLLPNGMFIILACPKLSLQNGMIFILACPKLSLQNGMFFILSWFFHMICNVNLKAVNPLNQH